MDAGQKDKMEGNGDEERNGLRQKWTEGGAESRTGEAGCRRNEKPRDDLCDGAVALLALHFYD